MFGRPESCEDVAKALADIDGHYFVTSDEFDHLCFAIQATEHTGDDEWKEETYVKEPKRRMEAWVSAADIKQLMLVWNCCMTNNELAERRSSPLILFLTSWALVHPDQFEAVSLPFLLSLRGRLEYGHSLVVDMLAEELRSQKAVPTLEALACNLDDEGREYVMARLLELRGITGTDKA
jgi:hypothetical protein